MIKTITIQTQWVVAKRIYTNKIHPKNRQKNVLDTCKSSHCKTIHFKQIKSILREVDECLNFDTKFVRIVDK